ncbi:uncharacterized protein K444DRAFT_624411 [Hyaloscypha bicolor E]|uniref:Phosphatidylglycerol lysyltransferase C-terminal domain-containing protein n=1 Tax=Hyaloscypha bicolor E TaxID=1095630 RepID=A0A2J6TS75_9HELO|nr:uncharacterized protein K444DRAFT_624411 [Hyaloscypha bicolor E]PMD65866.1 hypothetical protein K444DRAFT_624411 [Hyaloscypha bicolor E]
MANPSNSTEQLPVEQQSTNGKKNKANATKKRAGANAANGAAKAAKAVISKQTFSQKLGSDLADGLLKDSRSLEESMNLVDRVTFVKASTAQNGTSTTTIVTATAIQEQAEIVISGEIDALNLDAVDIVRPKNPRNIFDLDDFAALSALEELIGRYGRVSHMGILDKSYTFFITEDRKAALYYKVKDKIAIVGGDPLCDPSLFPQVLCEFEKYRKKQGLGIAFLAAGQTFVAYARKENWTTMCFATERVLNPITNPVLQGTAGKSIVRTTKNLLDPKKEGITLEVYTPRLGKNPRLQQQLVNVYEEWRGHRNGLKDRNQAYITVYDPFALPELMTYIYTQDRSGMPNGFAALRILGANKGYHLDPCIATPGAPKGITDLLLYGAMALLNTAKISYLSLGYEPLDDLGEITGIPNVVAKMSRKVHKRIFRGLHVAGKKGYHDKFRPDETQQSNLYLVFPPGIPSLRHMTAIVHVANIKIHKVIFERPPAAAVENEKEAEGNESVSDQGGSAQSSAVTSTERL